MGHRKTLLIVDDVELNREILASIVSEEYDTIMAKNGLEGLSILREKCEDIAAVILDIQMPVMDGFEFLEIVSSDVVLKQIPVIVTTILAEDGTEERCLALGAADFIVRPFNSAIVLARVKNILRLKESVFAIERLESESQVDLLTGLKNRRGFYKDLNVIKQSTEADIKPAGVLYLDINGLKRVNDLSGHAAGDNLIKNVAHTVKKIFDDANIYRLGGDEFLVIEQNGTKELFEKRIGLLVDCWDDDKAAAIGYMWLKDCREIDAAILEADKKMYLDKNTYYSEKNGNYRRAEYNLNMTDDIDEWIDGLPGGFVMFDADSECELIKFNSELVRIFECDDGDELKAFTDNSFKEIVKLEDISINETAIKAGESRKCCITTKKGNKKWICNYNRIFNSSQYGRVVSSFIVECYN